MCPTDHEPALGAGASPLETHSSANDTASEIKPLAITLPPPNKAPDKVFLGMAAGSGYIIVGLIALIAAFLLWQAIPSLSKNEANFLTSNAWTVNDTTSPSVSRACCGRPSSARSSPCAWPSRSPWASPC